MKVTFTEGRTDASEEHPTGQPDWRWRLDGDNGEPLSVSSEGYVALVDCEYGFLRTSGGRFATAHGAKSDRIVRHVWEMDVVEEIEVVWENKPYVKNADGDSQE